MGTYTITTTSDQDDAIAWQAAKTGGALTVQEVVQRAAEETLAPLMASYLAAESDSIRAAYAKASSADRAAIKQRLKL